MVRDYTREMENVVTLGKRFWRWFITPPSSTTLWRRAAWGLWTTPPILLFPLVLPILEPWSLPHLLAKYWDIYLLFFGLPFALGAYCWRRANRAVDAA